MAGLKLPSIYAFLPGAAIDALLVAQKKHRIKPHALSLRFDPVANDFDWRYPTTSN
jgi:hypothetical protein